MAKKKTSNKRNTNHPKKIRRILFGAVVVMALGITATLGLIYPRAPKTADIRLPENPTYETLADTLASRFGADYAQKVIRIIRLSRADISSRDGYWKIEKGTPLFKVARRIASGAQTPVRITINSFRTLDDIAAGITRRTAASPLQLKEALLKPQNLEKYGLSPQDASALFLNDTYEIYWSTRPNQIIKKIGDNYLKFWTPERRKKAEKLGLSPAQVITLASIVEEESNDRNERPIIGQLYLNRLNKGMRLQSDPTVKFAIGDFSIKRINTDHLQFQSPYNTYRNPGLPPGPIRTVDKTTVDAILNSQPNSYLYMCAKEDLSGTHNFASTFAEHTANARKYRQALDRMNIH